MHLLTSQIQCTDLFYIDIYILCVPVLLKLWMCAVRNVFSVSACCWLSHPSIQLHSWCLCVCCLFFLWLLHDKHTSHRWDSHLSLNFIMPAWPIFRDLFWFSGLFTISEKKFGSHCGIFRGTTESNVPSLILCSEVPNQWNWLFFEYTVWRF